ncbi:hypothetical protein [Falsiroseomonas selenitidurans]|uniref:Uncharacterized protein n=1 Tax=Falsiroseomonas selenitidurans TaxID=2716335 RepID=A0ABX1DXS0_9PROT|nr:hypothetical protein [Falsiroseomonas selenitidurans]NKC29666.1 hypothetical protein [Falsiroseomonas selenitidurans]
MRPIRHTSRNSAYRFTDRSDLRLMVVRMISMNSLAAFTAEVSRTQAPAQARAAAAGPQPLQALQTPQRQLDSLPPPPSGNVPRGSLLDLRV